MILLVQSRIYIGMFKTVLRSMMMLWNRSQYRDSITSELTSIYIFFLFYTGNNMGIRNIIMSIRGIRCK